LATLDFLLTKFAVVRARSRRPLFRSRRCIGRPRRHHAISTASAVSSGPWSTVVSLLCVVATLVVHASSALPILWHAMLRRLGSAASARHAHVAHGATHLARLNIAQGLLEVVDVSSGLADLGLDTRADSRVVGGLGHLAGGVDDGIFAVYFADKLLDGVVVVVTHGVGGVVARDGAGRDRVVEGPGWWLCECCSRVVDVDVA
jgi:hypothetical protein